MSRSLRCARDDSVGEEIATALRPRTTHYVWVQGPSSPTSYPAPCTRAKRVVRGASRWHDQGRVPRPAYLQGAFYRIMETDGAGVESRPGWGTHQARRGGISE